MVVALAHVRLPQINHDPQWVLMMHKPTMTPPILVGIQRRSTFCNIALATCRIATQVHICVTKRLKARTPTGTTPALAAGVTGTKLRLVGGTQTAHDGVCRTCTCVGCMAAPHTNAMDKAARRRGWHKSGARAAAVCGARLRQQTGTHACVCVRAHMRVSGGMRPAHGYQRANPRLREGKITESSGQDQQKRPERLSNSSAQSAISRPAVSIRTGSTGLGSHCRVMTLSRGTGVRPGIPVWRV